MSQQTRANRCENCAFYNQSEFKGGNPGISGPSVEATAIKIFQCRRYPPIWPEVRLDYWCGEWKQADKVATVPAPEKPGPGFLIYSNVKPGMKLQCMSTNADSMFTKGHFYEVFDSAGDVAVKADNEAVTLLKRSSTYWLIVPEGPKLQTLEGSLDHLHGEQPNGNNAGGEGQQAGVGANIRKRGRPKKASVQAPKEEVKDGTPENRG